MSGAVVRVCLLLALCCRCEAAFVSLVTRGRGLGLLFSDPTAWSGGVVPGPGYGPVVFFSRVSRELAGDDVLIGEACVGGFQWVVLDVNASVRSLTVQASARSNCSAPSLHVAASLQVSGAVVVGVTGPGFLFLETSSEVECASGVVGEQGTVVGSGSFVAHSTVQIAGSLWPGGTGLPVCCWPDFWPGSWNVSGASTGTLVVSAPDITLVGADVTMTAGGQFLVLEGLVNSSFSGLQTVTVAGDVGQQPITWTSITSDSSFQVSLIRSTALLHYCGCSDLGNDPPPFQTCATTSGTGLGVIVHLGGSPCPCSGCPSDTHCTDGGVCACDNRLDSPLCIASLGTAGGTTQSGQTTTSGLPGQSSTPAAGLSGGAIAGIVVGSVVLAGAAVAAVMGAKMHAAKSAATVATLRMNANPTHQ
jgi:hypothetical protein